jgi:SAM-dependent methyltransferase
MYESTIAAHYAAYRPPLYKTILESVFTYSRNRNIGIDVGCGTGRSSAALTNFCNHVIGIDPSMAMLREATVKKAINYVNAPGEKIPISENSIDVVTIAGSLNYIDRKLLTHELKRICRCDAEIAIYDFKIDLSDFETRLMLENSNVSQDYNHSLNLSEFIEVEELLFDSREVTIELKPYEIVHLLLSHNGWHSALRERFDSHDLFGLLKTEIEMVQFRFTLKADIYYSLYSLSEN